VTYICVHGIRSKGTSNVDKMGSLLEERGHPTVDFDYPTVSLTDVLFKMRGTRTKEVLRHARRLRFAATDSKVPRMKPDVIAHSMGCLVTLRAMEDGAEFGNVFWFAPAMESDFVIPSWGCNRLWIIHNPNDKAIKVGSWLKWHPFGNMGLVGSKYEQFDYRIKNVQTDQQGDDWLGHNYAFDGDNLKYWTDYVEERS